MIEPETFRRRIGEALELAASTAAQSDYARDMPIADVVSEIFEIWHDIYHPSVPTFSVAFSRVEREALAEYGAILNSSSASLTGMTLREFHASALSGATCAGR
jgi:hypothetical protein